METIIHIIGNNVVRWINTIIEYELNLCGFCSDS